MLGTFGRLCEQSFTDGDSHSLTRWLPLQVDETVTHSSLRFMLAGADSVCSSLRVPSGLVY